MRADKAGARHIRATTKRTGDRAAELDCALLSHFVAVEGTAERFDFVLPLLAAARAPKQVFESARIWSIDTSSDFGQQSSW